MAEYSAVRFQNESSESQDVDTLCPPHAHSRGRHRRSAKMPHGGDGGPRQGISLAWLLAVRNCHVRGCFDLHCGQAKCGKSQKKISRLTVACRAEYPVVCAVAAELEAGRMRSDIGSPEQEGSSLSGPLAGRNPLSADLHNDLLVSAQAETYVHGMQRLVTVVQRL